MSTGLPDFTSAIDLAAQSLISSAVDISAQSLAAINTDNRYGTAGASYGSIPIDAGDITLFQITGKGVIFGGSWIIVHDEVGVAPGMENIIVFTIDGEDHEFRSLKEVYEWNLSAPDSYQPSVTVRSAENNLAAGYLPGPITFEQSFAVRVISLVTTGVDEIDARVFYAISL